MKTSTGLALSLITVLSLRASAQTAGDEAFNAAYGKVPTAATMAQLRAQPQRPAPPVPAAPAVKPPAAADDVWAKVIEKVKKDGRFTAGADPLPSDFTIEEVVGDEKADHASHVISFMGEINDDGLFEAMGALIVLRDYKIDPKDGNFRIDSWMFMTDVHGQVFNAVHMVSVETPAGEPVSNTPEKLSPADPRLQAQLDSMLKHWSERKP